ncbi:hypothetical protein [Nocardia bhagyanarayanae]|uniref:hypothetical protein n=1 Tax=Nocardia bhagyanarayanae TaxID=1215925 RepID=UPI00163B1F7F|nr:hypothetical protein [Nocardia bhagyanarayanae]
MTEYRVPADEISLLDYLFGALLDGRNSATTDGVRRALGREAKDFGEYVGETAAAGGWSMEEVPVPAC